MVSTVPANVAIIDDHPDAWRDDTNPLQVFRPRPFDPIHLASILDMKLRALFEPELSDSLEKVRFFSDSTLSRFLLEYFSP